MAQVAHAHVVRLARGDEQLVRVLPHGLEQPVAARVAVEFHERLVHEVREEVHDRARLHIAARGHRFGSLERPSAREDGKAPQEHALGKLEQVVAPVDRGAQRLLARQHGGVAAGQHTEAVREAGGDGFDGHRAHARGGELDRERQAVQAPADVRHVMGVLRRHLEIRLHRGGAIDEEAHRLRIVQHAHLVDRFARDVQRLAAGSQDAHVLACLQELLGEIRGRLEDVLAVVEDHQHALALRVARQRLDHRAPGILLHAQHRGERVRHALFVGHGRQLHEPHAVGEFEEQARAHLQRQARFPRAAHAHERGQAPGAERFADVGDLLLAADEARELRGQVVAPRRRGDAGAVSSISGSSVKRYPRPGTVATDCAPRSLRSDETCTCRLFSSTTRPGHTMSRSSFLVRTRSRWSMSAIRTSNARPPSAAGLPSTSSCRSEGRTSTAPKR
jgi:hypothetical protein